MALVLGANMEELLGLEAKCTGLSVTRLQGFDIPAVMQFVQIFSENLESYPFVEYPPVRAVPEAHDVKIVKQPLGVCGLITAWNGPLFLAFLKMLPAIAAGNTVIIKPAETASLAVVRAMELIQDLLPPGVVNVVTGLGPDVGAALSSHPGIAKISFTGSGRTGAMIQKEAADTMKRVTLELGGKGPGVVLPDAPIELTARGATYGFLLGSGQICISGTRLFVHESIHDELVARMAELAGKMKAGSQFDPELVECFIQTVRQRRDLHETGVQSVSKKAATSIGRQISRLISALDSRDAVGLQSRAGRLKGSAEKHGVPEIASKAANLETALEAGGDAIGILKAANELVDLCRSTQRAYLKEIDQTAPGPGTVTA